MKIDANVIWTIALFQLTRSTPEVCLILQVDMKIQDVVINMTAHCTMLHLQFYVKSKKSNFSNRKHDTIVTFFMCMEMLPSASKHDTQTKNYFYIYIIPATNSQQEKQLCP